MRSLRRVLFALATAGLVVRLARLRGAGSTPARAGGWRELSGPDLR